MFSIFQNTMRSILASSLRFKISTERKLSTLSKAKYEHTKLILSQHGFALEQIQRIIDSLESHLFDDSHKNIDKTLDTWRKNLRSKREIDENTFRNVFTNKEPRLLLMNCNLIEQRINMLKSLDLVRGTTELWPLFVLAPAGYFLQDWKEFLKKYFYITYKILPWIEPQIVRDASNPMVKYPSVVELTFNTIKTRFLFAQRTGFKEVNSNYKANLHSLLLFPVNEFVRMFSPKCTVEEFNALEKLNSLSTGEEDDKLFEDLVELAPMQSSKSLDQTVKEIYLLSEVK